MLSFDGLVPALGFLALLSNRCEGLPIVSSMAVKGTERTVALLSVVSHESLLTLVSTKIRAENHRLDGDTDIQLPGIGEMVRMAGWAGVCEMMYDREGTQYAGAVIRPKEGGGYAFLPEDFNLEGVNWREVVQLYNKHFPEKK